MTDIADSVDLDAHHEKLTSEAKELQSKNTRLSRYAYADRSEGSERLEVLDKQIKATERLITERQKKSLGKMQNQILDAAKIDRDDPELMKIVKESIDAGEEWTEEAWAARLDSFAEKRSRQLSVGPGAIAGGGGGKPVAPVDSVDLLKEIAHLQKHPVDNEAKIKALMKEGKSRGVLP